VIVVDVHLLMCWSSGDCQLWPKVLVQPYSGEKKILHSSSVHVEKLDFHFVFQCNARACTSGSRRVKKQKQKKQHWLRWSKLTEGRPTATQAYDAIECTPCLKLHSVLELGIPSFTSNALLLRAILPRTVEDRKTKLQRM
jgi:hypothetical protein